MTDEVLAAATIEKTPEELRAEQAERDAQAAADAKAKQDADEAAAQAERDARLHPGFAQIRDEPKPQTAANRQRAFEDEAIGPDVPRINGAIERGHGSLYSRLTDQQKAEYAKLERLVAAETRLAEAAARLSEAQAEYDSAADALDESKNGSG